MRKILNIFLLASILLMSCSNPNKIGFVDMAKVVYSYDGMKEGHVNYQNMEQEFKSIQTPIKLKLDSLRQMKSIVTTKDVYDSVARNEYLLGMQLQQISKQQIEELQQKDDELTGAIMNQIHAYTSEYAQLNEFDFILGQKDDNVLFGKESANITNELIEYLNKQYNAE